MEAREYHDAYSESLGGDFQELESALLSDTVKILAPSEPIRCSADATVQSAIVQMAEKRRAAVVVVDKEFKVLVWNDRASDLWGVRPEEARGSHFMSLDIGLPIGDLRPAIKAVLNDGAEQHQLIVPAVNRRGKPFECRLTLTPLMGGQRESAGVILLMEERKD